MHLCVLVLLVHQQLCHVLQNNKSVMQLRCILRGKSFSLLIPISLWCNLLALDWRNCFSVYTLKGNRFCICIFTSNCDDVSTPCVIFVSKNFSLVLGVVLVLRT